MRTSALFGVKKIQIFRNLWCVRTDKVGEGSNFRDLMRTSFMDGPLPVYLLKGKGIQLSELADLITI